MVAAAVVEQFYKALVAGDADGLRSLLDDGVFVAGVGGQAHGADAAVAALARLGGGGFRPWSDDSYDVLVSGDHGVVLDRWIREGEGQAEGRVDRHMALVVDVEDGRISAAFFYVHTDDAAAAFFAP